MSEAALARNDIGDISITISSDQRRIKGWAGLQIVRGIDQAADAFSFSFPWEATPENKRRFRAYRTSLIQIWYKQEIVVSGIMELVSTSWSADRREMQLDGRSFSGVLMDISAGPPFEISASFNQIAARLSPIYVRANPDITDLSIQIEPGQSVYDVLSKVAAARGLWAQPQPDGTLLFSKINASSPVADLREGEAPLISVDTSHDLTQRFAEYLIIQTIDGSTYTATATDNGVDADLRTRKIAQPQQESKPDEAAKFARARGIIDSYSLKATVTGWTVGGRLWVPGNTVTIYAPSAMVYRPYKMIVRRATLQLDESGGAITQLDLSFAEAYNGGLPPFPYPWSVTDG